MRFTRTLIVVLVGCGLALAQNQGGVESRPGNDLIKTQIKNLDNDSFELRTKAMEDLRASGDAARVELEAAMKSKSLEVRTRAETLLRELDAQKQPAVRKQTGVKPVAPDDERRQTVQVRGPVPSREDFGDQKAYVEALRKWMNEQMAKDSRFQRFGLPDDKDMDQDVQVIMPDVVTSGRTSMSVTTENGETRTFRSGPDGVTLKVQRRNEAGEPVVESWSAKDVDEFKTKHPEVWEKYHPTDRGSALTWSVRGGRAFPQVPATPATPFIDPNQPKPGVITSPVPAVLDKQLKLKGEGVVIDTVYPDSLAARMGMQELDVLLQLDGQVIHDRDDILRLLARKTPQATATARIVREGAVMELSAPREKGK